MITVRFASGLSIQYNSANFAMRSPNGYTDLCTKEGGSWVAQVPTAACVVEVVAPCRTYMAPTDAATLTKGVLAVLRDQRERECLSAADVAEMKSLLSAFDARSRRWR